MPLLREAVIAYILKGDRLLVFRHTDHPDAGTQVPAGTVEKGETLEEAVLREAKEETGLEGLEIIAYLGAVERRNTYKGRTGTERRHFFHLSCAGEAPELWLHREADPSDGVEESYEFELSWVRFPDEVPELHGEEGLFLSKIGEV